MYATRRSHSYTSVWALGKELDVIGHVDEEHSVVRSIFSCSVTVAHVPAPYIIVGVITASNRCNQCRSK